MWTPYPILLSGIWAPISKLTIPCLFLLQNNKCHHRGDMSLLSVSMTMSILVASKWFSLAFPKRLVVLALSLCTYWSFVYLLGRNVLSTIWYSFWYWSIHSLVELLEFLCLLWMKFSYQTESSLGMWQKLLMELTACRYHSPQMPHSVCDMMLFAHKLCKSSHIIEFISPLFTRPNKVQMLCK